MRLRITSQQVRLLRDEVSRVRPLEACALLFGRTDLSDASVERVITVPNVLRSTIRFEIDHKTFYDAFMLAQKDGLDFIGLFHSHPAAAFPSSCDLEFMRLWGDAVWLILSTLDNSFAAYRMQSGRVRKVKVKSDKA